MSSNANNNNNSDKGKSVSQKEISVFFVPVSGLTCSLSRWP